MKKNLLLLISLVILVNTRICIAQNAKIDSLLNVLKTCKEDSFQLGVLENISNQYISIGKYADNEKYSQQELVLADKLLASPVVINDSIYNRVCSKRKATALDNIGRYYYNSGNYTKAKDLYTAALKIREEINHKSGMATSYILLGLIADAKGDYDEALKYDEQALKIKRELGERKSVADVLINIGNIHHAHANSQEALRYYKESLQIREEIGDKRGKAVALINIASEENEQGNYADAMKYALDALHLCEETGDKKRMASSFGVIAGIYLNEHAYSDAMPNYEKQLNLLLEIGNKRGLSQVYNSIGLVKKRMGRFDDALTDYLKAVSISEELGAKSELANAYGNIANLYRDKKNYQEASRYRLKSLDLLNEINNTQSSLFALTALGNDYAAQGNYQEALNVLRKAIGDALTSGNREELAGIYNLMSSVCDSLKDYKNAYEYHVLFMNLKDSLHSNEKDKSIVEMTKKYETEKKDKEIKLLNQENEIKTLQAKKSQSQLLAAHLESEQKQNKIMLLSKDKEIQKLELSRREDELIAQKLLARSEADEIKMLNDEKKIKEEEAKSRSRFQLILIVGFAGLLVVLGLLFNRFKLKKKIERQQALLDERSRISNAMHDDIGSDLSKIAFLSEAMLRDKNHMPVKKQLEVISGSAREAISKTREIVWSVNPQNDTLENMTAYLRKYAAEYLEHTDIKLNFRSPKNISDIKINGELRRNIFLITKEALHNVMKHAEATEVNFSVAENKGYFEMRIHDNGKGIELKSPNLFSNGLKSMKQRAELSGGNFAVENGSGTTVKFVVKLEG